MPIPLAKTVNTHSYPALIHRYPVLLRLVHAATQLVTLRVWYVRRAIRHVLKSIPIPFTYLDAGCGGGDFLLPYAGHFPSSTFVGIDRAAENVAMCARYAEYAGLTNVRVEQARLETFNRDLQADIITCVSVLQYTEDDEGVLNGLHHVLSENGCLVLYVPVNGRPFFPFYKRWAERIGVNDYEQRQARQQIYTTGKVLDKLKRAGFVTESAVHSYGPAGAAYHEIYSLLLAAMLHSPRLLAPIPALALLILYPLLLVLMLADFIVHNRTGNGLLVVARRAGQ
jgi:2-polyprenyl-3-methyl-5-hydroxy-6-metoxy-1,4-benzoquinol methylase